LVVEFRSERREIWDLIEARQNTIPVLSANPSSSEVLLPEELEELDPFETIRANVCPNAHLSKDQRTLIECLGNGKTPFTLVNWPRGQMDFLAVLLITSMTVRGPILVISANPTSVQKELQ
jgi:hypothetical protein